MIEQNSIKKHSKIRPNTVTNFGVRKISNQNFSKVIAIPKMAIVNLGANSTEMKVELVQENGEKFIKLTPMGVATS
ncbi:MAG: hypothetical protein EPO37_06170 [Nitrosarchaeum sp.]|nr:MAG: hypothetical protein EPO37_06170 [Nitrosarchaeum sp.]